jgi:transcriptional regulator with XRE-family HTH domain
MDYKTADRLIELRKKNGLSQEDLAEKLNISRQAVSKWERAESLPDTENLIALSKLYGLSLDELVYGKKPESAESMQPQGNNEFLTLPISRKKALSIVSYVFLCLGIVFLLMGVVMYLVFAAPETRDLRLAQNENIVPVEAVVTRSEPSAISFQNERMYKIVFFCQAVEYKSNAAYSEKEANEMVGKTILVRMEGKKAVMVDYRRSALTIVGFLLLGIFGGIGVLFSSGFVLVFCINKKNKS